MMRRLAVLAFFLLALLASSGAHAGGFAFLWQRTNTAIESNPVITVMANTFDNDDQLKDVWSISQPNLQDVDYGDCFQLVLAASAKYIVGKDKKADEFLRKYGICVEWYKPSETGSIPYRYDRSKEAIEFNAVHRLPPTDPTDGNSPSKVDFYPAEVLNWNTYIQGANVKTAWLRIVNGSRLTKELELLGLIRFTTVSHDDVWIPIQVVFVTRPPKVESRSESREDRSAEISRNVNNIREIIADLQSRDAAIWQAYCAGQKVQDERLDQIEACLGQIRVALGDLTVRDDVLLSFITANAARDDTQDARLDRMETAREQFRASYRSTPAQPATTPAVPKMVHFRIAFVRASGQSMRTTASTAGLPLVAVQMECREDGRLITGYIQDGIAEYLQTGIASGTSMVFRVRQLNSRWSDPITITVTNAMEAKVTVVPVQ